MKILLIAPQPFYIDRGTPIAQELLIRTLGERGEHVDLVTYHLGADIERQNLTIHRTSGPGWIRVVRPGLSPSKLLCDLYLLRKAWQVARRGDHDLVHASEEGVLVAMALKKLLGLPYIYDMDSSLAQQVVEQAGWLKPLAPLLSWVEGRAIRGSVAVAPVCNALAELAREQGAPFVETLYDISQIAEADFREGAGLRERLGTDDPIVLYVGNFQRYQGVQLLLEATARVRGRGGRLQLVIAGGTETAIASHRAMAEQLGIGEVTRFIGRWPPDRLGMLLWEADILVSPRLTGINTPMKIFPYLHSGRPLLATAISSHTQILDESLAVLAPPDPEGFSRGLERLLNDEELRARLGAAGKAFVERHHTYPAYRERVDRLYDHASSAPHGVPARPDPGPRASAL